MKTPRVIDMVVPLKAGLPQHPSVTPVEPLTRAVELMATYSLKQIAVVHNQRIIGMVEFQQALQHLGLKPSFQEM